MRDFTRKHLPWIILICLSFIWGSSFILMKKSLLFFKPDQMAALRIFIAMLVLLPFVAGKLRNLRKKDFLLITLIGFLGNGIPAFAFSFAQTVLDSSVSGILNSLVPMFTLFAGILFFRLRPIPLHYIGVMIGFGGAVSLIYFHRNENTAYALWGALLVTAATICYAFNVNIIKKYLAQFDPVLITGGGLLVTGLCSFSYLLFSGTFSTLSGCSACLEGLGYIAILSVVGSALAVIVFNYLIKISSPLFSSSVTYMIPVFAIGWGIIDGERGTWIDLASVVIILAGVYLVNYKPKSAEKHE